MEKKKISGTESSILTDKLFWRPLVELTSNAAFHGGEQVNFATLGIMAYPDPPRRNLPSLSMRSKLADDTENT